MKEKANIFYTSITEEDLDKGFPLFVRLPENPSVWIPQEKKENSISLFDPLNPAKGIFLRKIEFKAEKKKEELFFLSPTYLEKTVKAKIAAQKQEIKPEKKKTKAPTMNLLFENPAKEEPRAKEIYFDKKKIRKWNDKPFTEGLYYGDAELYPFVQDYEILFGKNLNKSNLLICISAQNPPQLFTLSSPPSPDFFENLLVLPLYIYGEADKQEWNISDRILNRFKKKYLYPKEEQDSINEEALQSLFNFSDFENCQVTEDLAAEIRNLTHQAEHSKDAQYLRQHIGEASDKLEESFANFKMIFDKAKRVFDRIGQKACRNVESFEILNHYFAAASEGVEMLEQYFSLENYPNAQIQAKNAGLLNKENIFYYALSCLFANTLSQKSKGKTEIPFHPHYFQWVQWGKELMKLCSNPPKLSFQLEVQSEILHKKAKPFDWQWDMEHKTLLLDYQLERNTVGNLPKEIFELVEKGNLIPASILEVFKQAEGELKEKAMVERVELLMEILHTLSAWSIEWMKIWKKME